MGGVCHLASKVLGFRVENPADHCVIYWNTEGTAKYLGEECCARWYVHIVTNLLILKHELGSILEVSLKKCYPVQDIE